jgi:UDP-GlcNAc:undecaprenyl-phosphate GlcNAc-1-phosphate transferase
MLESALLLLLPCCASVVMTRVMLRLSIRYQAVDRPDGRRKLHASAIPIWGGVAVYLALIGGILLVRSLPAAADERSQRLIHCLLASVSMIFALGFVDDRYDLRGRLKLMLQIVSVSPLILAGFWCREIGLLGYNISLGWFGVPFTMFWLIGSINAMNLLDGMDGNASVVGAIASAAVAVIAAQMGLYDVAGLAMVMCGAILGFLVYNLPPAKIYLGDAGSTTIGLVLGVLAMQGARDHIGVLRVTAPLVVLTVPILDCTLAVLRRKLTGRRFDHADRGHIHHRLQDRGLSTWQALRFMGLLGLMSALAGTASIYLNVEPLAWLTAVTLVVALAQLRYFGHHERVLIRRSVNILFASVVQRLSLRRHRARWRAWVGLPRWSFNDSWEKLADSLSNHHVARIEFCMWCDNQPVASLTREFEGGMPRSNWWRLHMGFGPRGNTWCEICVSGRDASFDETRNLAEVAGIMQVYGRYWVRNPAMVLTECRPATVILEPHPEDDLRRAA